MSVLAGNFFQPQKLESLCLEEDFQKNEERFTKSKKLGVLAANFYKPQNLKKSHLGGFF
ncbi:hypothetical protein [Kaistella daneshvariae]|uniref:hypothetical protein n=1 Tax=Kaistella daneshvariae TaxID=2487074 RepID=UPI0013DE6093|nr:hypothetical protein [Kaistella daneshvariae]